MRHRWLKGGILKFGRRSRLVLPVLMALMMGPGLVQALPLSGGESQRATLSSMLEECDCENPAAEISGFAAELTAAGSVTAARERALEQVSLAERAARVASVMLPGSSTVDDLEHRLGGYRERVEAAGSPVEVAAAFDDLTRPQNDVNIDGDGPNCDFTGTEILIIVIGFILGIIPGVIFLILFC